VQRKRYSLDIPDWARFALEVWISLILLIDNSNINHLWRRGHRLGERKVTHDLLDGETSTMSIRKKSAMEHSHWDSLIGMTLYGETYLFRDPPRPAVAPFSETGMVDELGYPSEKSDEEDEVMMDFVSRR
jgi:hypothetical protein